MVAVVGASAGAGAGAGAGADTDAVTIGRRWLPESDWDRIASATSAFDDFVCANGRLYRPRPLPCVVVLVESAGSLFSARLLPGYFGGVGLLSFVLPASSLLSPAPGACLPACLPAGWTHPRSPNAVHLSHRPLAAWPVRRNKRVPQSAC